MPHPGDLPPALSDLARRQAHEVRDSRWNDDVLSLIGTLSQQGPRAVAERPEVLREQRSCFYFTPEELTALHDGSTKWRLKEAADIFRAPPLVVSGLTLFAARPTYDARHWRRDIMSQQDVQIMREGYEIFSRKDIPGVLERFDPQIEWTEPGGGGAPGGTFRGPQEVAQAVFSAIPQSVDEFNAVPEQFIDAGDHVVVVGRFRGRSKRGA